MARLTVEVTEKGIKKTQDGLKKLGNQGKATESQFKSFGKNAAAAVASVDGPLGGISSRITSLTTLASSGTLVITGLAASVAALSAATYQGVKVLADYEVNLARTQALIESTGAAAGFTAQQLQEQAEALALNTLTGVKNVQKAQSVLLTFNRVSGDVFKEAITLSQDLAETGFGSIESNAVQLGKALQDPITGITALTRVGITFNDAQKEQIRLAQQSGDTLKAQGVIIQAVAGQVGGAGAGVAKDSLAGKIDTAGQYWDNFTKTLADKSGAFDASKKGIDLLNSALVTLTDTLTGGSIDEQLTKSNLVVDSLAKQVDAQKELLATQERNIKAASTQYGAQYAGNSTLTKQKEKIAELERQLTIETENRDKISTAVSKRESDSEEARLKGIKKQQELESQAAADKKAQDDKSLSESQARDQAAIDSRVASLQAGFDTEKDIYMQRVELIKQSSLDEAEQLHLINQLRDEYNQKVISDSQDVAKKQSDIDAKRLKSQQATNDRAAGAWDSMTQDLKSTLGEQNALFKASATINATIKTYEAATSAYAALAPIPFVGPALGAAAAGVAIAAGLANVQAINSARAQGGQVNRGDSVLVGERGPEVVTMGASGAVTPNHKLQDGRSTAQNIVNVYNNTDASVSVKDNDSGGSDIYITREELPDAVGALAADQDSALNSNFQSMYDVARR